jgi:hypothetical protein
MTPGRLSLLALLQRLPGREVALRAHVSPASVSSWSGGYWTPSPSHRTELQRQFGITPSSWDVQKAKERAGD